MRGVPDGRRASAREIRGGWVGAGSMNHRSLPTRWYRGLLVGAQRRLIIGVDGARSRALRARRDPLRRAEHVQRACPAEQTRSHANCIALGEPDAVQELAGQQRHGRPHRLMQRHTG